MLQLHPLINQLNQAKNQALNNQPKVTNYMRNTGGFVNEGDAPTKQPTVPTPNVQPPINQPAAPPPVTQAPPAFDQNSFLKNMQDGINGMYDAQQQSRLAALKASRDKATGQINLQDAQLAPQYADKRNQADVVSQQNVDRLRELMAANGLQSSGENVSATVGLQSARQGALNDLNTQEQQQHNDFAQRIADLNDPAQEQAVISELQAQRAQALLDATNRANDVGYQRQQGAIQNAMAEAGITGKYNGQDTLVALQASKQNALAEAGLTGYYNGNATMDKQNSDRSFNLNEANVTGKYNGQDTMAAIDANRNFAVNQASVTGKYNGQNTYQANQDSIANKRADEAAKAAAKQQAADNAWRQYQYTHMSASEKAQLAKDVSQFGETKAWEMFQLKYNGELAKAQSKAQIAALTP